MTVLRGVFDQLDWPTLVPCPELLAEQPGDADIGAFVAVARTADGTVVCYAPLGGAVRFRDAAALPMSVRRVDPRTGVWSAAEPLRGGVLTLPQGADWLAVLHVGGALAQRG
jgi:hypothetical protein